MNIFDRNHGTMRQSEAETEQETTQNVGIYLKMVFVKRLVPTSRWIAGPNKILETKTNKL